MESFINRKDERWGGAGMWVFEDKDLDMNRYKMVESVCGVLSCGIE